jgi:hypothetical protein
MDKNEMIMINQGRYFCAKSDSPVALRWLVFAPDGQFYDKYASKEEAEGICNGLNENGQAEKRHKDATAARFDLEASEGIIWGVRINGKWHSDNPLFPLIGD